MVNIKGYRHKDDNIVVLDKSIYLDAKDEDFIETQICLQTEFVDQDTKDKLNLDRDREVSTPGFIDVHSVIAKFYKCSSCGDIEIRGAFKYCPHCRAVLDWGPWSTVNRNE